MHFVTNECFSQLYHLKKSHILKSSQKYDFYTLRTIFGVSRINPTKFFSQ